MQHSGGTDVQSGPTMVYGYLMLQGYGCLYQSLMHCLVTTEPLWAALCAVLLLGDTLTTSNYVGGALILTALAVQNELLPSLSSEDEEAREDSTQD